MKKQQCDYPKPHVAHNWVDTDTSNPEELNVTGVRYCQGLKEPTLRFGEIHSIDISPIEFAEAMTQKDIGVKDVKAGVVPIRVVAAKLTGHWIIRAIGAFESFSFLYKTLTPYIVLYKKDSVEITQHEYSVPGYLAYAEDELRVNPFTSKGVYVWWCTGIDTYRNPEKLGDL